VHPPEMTRPFLPAVMRQLLCGMLNSLRIPNRVQGAKRQPADAPMTEEMFDAEKFDSGAWISMATNMRGFTQYSKSSTLCMFWVL
jgi:hypothetical protein